MNYLTNLTNTGIYPPIFKGNDNCSNIYGKQLVDNLDFTKYEIHSSGTPTFLAKNGHSCIDFIIASQKLSNILTSCFTDEDVPLYGGAPIRGHMPFLCGIKASQVQEPNISVLNLSTMNWLKWSSELDQLLLVIENTDDTTYL